MILHNKIKICLFLLLLTIFFVSFASGETKNESSPNKSLELEKKIRDLANRYIALEDLFREARDFSNKTIPHTGLNISLVKSKEVKSTLKAIEVAIDKTIIRGDVLTEDEDHSLSMGGRQSSYDGDISEGLHTVTCTLLIQNLPSDTKFISVTEDIRLQIIGGITLFLEVELTATGSLPGIKYNSIGETEGYSDDILK